MAEGYLSSDDDLCNFDDLFRVDDDLFQSSDDEVLNSDDENALLISLAIKQMQQQRKNNRRIWTHMLQSKRDVAGQYQTIMHAIGAVLVYCMQ